MQPWCLSGFLVRTSCGTRSEVILTALWCWIFDRSFMHHEMRLFFPCGFHEWLLLRYVFFLLDLIFFKCFHLKIIMCFQVWCLVFMEPWCLSPCLLRTTCGTRSEVTLTAHWSWIFDMGFMYFEMRWFFPCGSHEWLLWMVCIFLIRP